MLVMTHFFGETAEHVWPELNQLGAQTRQMNNGHCQDTIIDHHSHWNWTKTSNIGRCTRFSRRFWILTFFL